MKILVVGLGSIGTRHLNNLHTLGVEELSVYRSRNLPPPAEVGNDQVKFHNNYEEALSSGPDAVVIANPTAFHVEFAKKALEAGCHVYMEKPVSHNLEGIAELTELAGKQDKVVMVGCQLRFHPNLEAVREWVRDGLTGRIFSVNVDMGEYLPGWHPWEDYRQSYSAKADMGGGVILTLIHELDYIFWIFGPVKSVYAIGGQLTPLEMDAEDTALISLLTKQGVPVLLRMDYWRNPPVRKMNIVCENGEVDWDYYTGEATLTNGGNIIKRSSLPGAWDRNNLFMAAMKDFLNSVREQSMPRIPLAEGITVLEIALAAKRSMTEEKIISL